MTVVLDDLTVPIPSNDQLPPLDRSDADLSEASPLERQWAWDGAVILRGFMPDDRIDAYCADWLAVNDVETGRSRWPETAYMHSRAARDLCLYPPLVEKLSPLVGGEVGLHLCLTGWRSTTRDLHQDGYLNPSLVGSHYAAVWIALADVDPDCGPFQYVPGSHRWPWLSQERIIPALGLDLADPDWPRKTEEILTPLAEAEITRRDAALITPELHRGDVLVWHPYTFHRGSVPRVPGLERRAMIAHYSEVSHRPDMATWEQHGEGFYYAHEQPLHPA